MSIKTHRTSRLLAEGENQQGKPHPRRSYDEQLSAFGPARPTNKLPPSRGQRSTRQSGAPTARARAAQTRLRLPPANGAQFGWSDGTKHTTAACLCSRAKSLGRGPRVKRLLTDTGIREAGRCSPRLGKRRGETVTEREGKLCMWHRGVFDRQGIYLLCCCGVFHADTINRILTYSCVTM